jgi:hypothetical protein
MATAWADLIKRGYRVHHSVTIEGIPYLFAAGLPRRVDAAASPSLPSGYTSDLDVLWITEGQAVGIELDRQTGVSRGTAWDVILSWQGLEDAGILDDLFGRPTLRAELTADLDSAATTITVDSTSGMTGLAHLYLGRETITFSGSSGTTFTGCTRGVVGTHVGSVAYDYQQNSPSVYRVVADRPQVWRGRFVELHGHLVSPEGRIVASTWCAGDYHRVLWRGYIDASPRPTLEGMALRALPLCRLLAADVGYDVAAKVAGYPSEFNSWAEAAAFPVYATPGAQVSISVEYGGAGSGTWTYSGPAIGASADPMTLGEWVSMVHTELQTEVAGEAWLSAAFADAGGGGLFGGAGGVHAFGIKLFAAATYSINAATGGPKGGAYWVTDAEPLVLGGGGVGVAALLKFPVKIMGDDGGWLGVYQSDGDAWQDVAMPSAGLGVLESDDAREVIRWEASNAAGAPLIFLHVVQRGLGFTPKVDIVAGATLKVASGTIAAPQVAALRIIESSGTTERGTYDTLALGFGLGVPDTFVNEASFGYGLLSTWQNTHAVATGRSSVESILGGWYALHSRCITQRPDPTSNDSVLMGVSTQPTTYPFATELAKADVLLSTVDTPELAEWPNAVRVIRDGISDITDVVVHDVPRIQAEGPRSMDIRAPSIPVPVAVGFAINLTHAGDGQALLAMSVGPWVNLHVGDPCKVTIAHPLLFDWAAGSRAPATVYARVVGWSLDLYTGAQRLTLLLAGQAVETQYLCPSATVVTKDSSTQVTLTAGEGAYFVGGDVVTIYARGQESSREATYTINTVVGDVVTFTGALASWVGTGSIQTYPPRASATASQDDFMYDNAANTWEP